MLLQGFFEESRRVMESDFVVRVINIIMILFMMSE
jgi:hypothetical protein